MNTCCFRLCLWGVACFFSSSHVLADRGFRESIATANDVPDAVTIVTERLERQGFTIELVVDHAANAVSVGQALRPTQVIFASPPPIVERLLLARSMDLALDLPLKFLVFETDAGDVQFFFNDVGYLVDRHDVALRDPLFYVLDRLQSQFGDLDSGVVVVPSEQSYDATVLSIQTALSNNPALRVPPAIDFSGSLRRGRKQVLILFGNPVLGSPLLATNQQIGVDLPQELLVSQDRRGNVTISYNDPFAIARRHQVTGQDEILMTIANALKTLSSIGAGTN